MVLQIKLIDALTQEVVALLRGLVAQDVKEPWVLSRSTQRLVEIIKSTRQPRQSAFLKQGLPRLCDAIASHKHVIHNVIQQAWHLGYAGCLAWCYQFKVFTYADRNTAFAHALIYRNGSPRPIAQTTQSFLHLFAN